MTHWGTLLVEQSAATLIPGHRIFKTGCTPAVTDNDCGIEASHRTVPHLNLSAESVGNDFPMIDVLSMARTMRVQVLPCSPRAASSASTPRSPASWHARPAAQLASHARTLHRTEHDAPQSVVTLAQRACDASAERLNVLGPSFQPHGPLDRGSFARHRSNDCHKGSPLLYEDTSFTGLLPVRAFGVPWNSDHR